MRPGHDLQYDTDLNAAAYMQSAYDQMPSYKTADSAFTYPNVTPAQSQSSFWNMPQQRQTQPQYYNVSASTEHTDPQQSYSNLPLSNLSEWWQPRPTNNPYNSVFDSWNYQIDEPCVYGEDASQHLKLQSLSTLDNLVRTLQLLPSKHC